MCRWLSRLFVLGLLPLASVANAQALASIKAFRHLDCGTVQSVDDWNGEDVHGDLSALGVDVCRAVAAAILGDAAGLSIHAFPAEAEALAALQAGEIQLAVGVSPSAAAAVQFGVGFGPPVFYDSQRILVAKQSGIADLAGLRDQVICALDMSAPERTLRDELTARNISYSLMSHSEQGELDAAVAVRRCGAATGMESRLAQSRANFRARMDDFVFLPERLALAPVVPAYPDKDRAFGRIVDWTISALIEAEALGVAKDNVAEASKREDMRADQLLGHDFATAQALGLARDWAAKVIATTGNYREIFARTMGEPYRLERGLNALWTQGGLMAPMPMK
ncbi:MAG: transporter substrate-binding domain-containing protein [Hyphomicrobiales bacterium]|nr:transporter substrate-binding domain-containing protein [Hyphomicrobiales bacterium]